MIRKLVFSLIGTVVLCSQANAAFIPYGVQQDVALSGVTDVWGWNLLYRDNYSVNSVSIADAFDGHGDYVMLGAIRDGSNTIELLAAISWGRDRTPARATVGGGVPAPLFRLRDGFTFPP